MKKLLLIPALMLGSIAMAKEYKYEITPIIGYNRAEGNLNLKDQFLTGAEFQLNTDTLLKPELSVLFTNTDYEELVPANPSTDIWRFAINGVHDFDAIGAITPLVKIGVGYETLNVHLADNKDSVFFNAGAGVKAAITENIALKLEAVYMNKRADSNLALLAGINFAFGPKAQEVPPAPIDGDDDNDGVLNSVDECPNTPAGTKVNAVGCKIDGDDDNDGVLNSVDECLNTPAGTSVDAVGCKIVALTQVVEAAAVVCPPKINLHINFKFDSSEIKEESKPRVNEFSEFLKCTPVYKANIIGHTDAVGSDAYNLKLSDRRANAVKDMIVKYGVPADKVSTTAKGETEPIATNKTSEGRAQNRRIEAELIKN
ncbi:MAG: OmpA family protein [Sulfurimonas sp.]